MFTSSLLALATTLAAASAQVYRGFNYASVFTDGFAITQTDYEKQFSTAQKLVGTSAFTSARLFTMIQAGTTNTPTQAIPAAISTKTSLLLGLFLSSDQAVFNNELTALRSAISTYGQDFVDLIAGISVGSEDLYRISPIGIENDSGAGVEPAQVADYIGQVRSLIAGTAAGGKVVGHVDTWTAYVNSSNNAVIDACDFIGMDAYPYFQNTMSNAIESGKTLFFDAYNATVAVAGGKPVWITETGWPVSGPTENLAVASTENAQTYWNQVACSVLGEINTWWYILQDAYPTAPNPSFGVVGTALSTTPLYDLSCDAGTSSVSSSSSASPISSSSVASTLPASSDSSTSTAKPVSDATPSTQSGSSSATAIRGSNSALGGSASTLSVATTMAPFTSKLGPEPASSVANVKTYTAMTTSPVTYTSGSQTRISMTTSAVVLTSTVGSTLSTVVQTSTATSDTAVAVSNKPAGSCPSSLFGEFQYPHLIVPVNKDSPDTPQGNSYNAHFSPTISSIFNFDIPPSYKGLTCSLIFVFPTRETLQTSNYTLSGKGGIEILRLQDPATAATTYESVPAVSAHVGAVPDLQAGSGNVISSGPCFAGARISYEISATGDLDLEYFQDYNPAPIGLYITVC